MATTTKCDRCGRDITGRRMYRLALVGGEPDSADVAALGEYCSLRCVNAVTQRVRPDFAAARKAAGLPTSQLPVPAGDALRITAGELAADEAFAS